MNYSNTIFNVIKSKQTGYYNNDNSFANFTIPITLVNINKTILYVNASGLGNSNSFSPRCSLSSDGLSILVVSPTNSKLYIDWTVVEYF